MAFLDMTVSSVLAGLDCCKRQSRTRSGERKTILRIIIKTAAASILAWSSLSEVTENLMLTISSSARTVPFHSVVIVMVLSAAAAAAMEGVVAKMPTMNRRKLCILDGGTIVRENWDGDKKKGLDFLII